MRKAGSWDHRQVKEAAQTMNLIGTRSDGGLSGTGGLAARRAGFSPYRRGWAEFADRRGCAFTRVAVPGVSNERVQSVIARSIRSVGPGRRGRVPSPTRLLARSLAHHSAGVLTLCLDLHPSFRVCSRRVPAFAQLTIFPDGAMYRSEASATASPAAGTAPLHTPETIPSSMHTRLASLPTTLAAFLQSPADADSAFPATLRREIASPLSPLALLSMRALLSSAAVPCAHPVFAPATAQCLIAALDAAFAARKAARVPADGAQALARIYDCIGLLLRFLARLPDMESAQRAAILPLFTQAYDSLAQNVPSLTTADTMEAHYEPSVSTGACGALRGGDREVSKRIDRTTRHVTLTRTDGVLARGLGWGCEKHFKQGVSPSLACHSTLVSVLVLPINRPPTRRGMGPTQPRVRAD